MTTSKFRQEKNKGNYVVINTKVSPMMARLLERISSNVGVSTFRFVQAIVCCMVKYMDKTHVASDELEQLMQMFLGEVSKCGTSYNFADPSAKASVTDAIFFIGDHRRGEGRQSVLVSSPFMGQVKENWNVMEQLEMLVCSALPDWYRKLRVLGARLDTRNVYETLQAVINDALAHDPDSDYLRELFSHDDYSDDGKRLTLDHKRTRRARPATDEPTLFDDGAQ